MKKTTILLLLITIKLFIANSVLAMEGAKSLPLLPSGKYITITEGYNPSNPSKTQSNINLRWKEAVSKGMRVSTIQFDWSQLEYQPYKYNKNLLESTLKRMQSQGLKPYVVIPTIDTDRLSMPSDLVDYNTRTWLKNGMKLDNQRVIDRFNRLLDWVVPMVVAHGGWALSVANEPNTYIVDRNEEDRAFLKPSIVNFLSAVRSHSHSINSDLAISMTLSQNLIESGETFHRNLLEECDVAMFTYYAVDPSYYFASDETEVNQEIDELLAAAGDKYVVLQELGAASGYGYAGDSSTDLNNNDSYMNASFNKQKRFLNIVFTKMQSERRFRVATVFQLVDWQDNLVETEHLQYYRDEGIVSSAYLDRFGESLETTGVLHFADGSRKPAWYAFINWVQRINNGQSEPVITQDEPIETTPEPVQPEHDDNKVERQQELERERLEQERKEKARLEQARKEQERLEQARKEKVRLEQAREEQERLEQARKEKVRLEQARKEKARLERRRNIAPLLD